ncbi:MAG TPA: endopeptidase La [Candidatus Faeciplasma avium]|uniref:Lon protease n=1 Tax=Candidatus Faeciplasma avium TaxID=2840798 RepID=A0A9D1T4E8_9FIRM|nr:endopeptidase La [Candidatus Faeciplasma avium]
MPSTTNKQNTRPRSPAAELPFIATRDVVVFPNMRLKFDIMREMSVASLRQALASNGLIFLAAQKKAEIMEPEFSDIYHVGTVCEIKQIVNSGDGVTRVRVRGLYKARLLSLSRQENGLVASVRRMRDCVVSASGGDELEAVSRFLKSTFQVYANAFSRISDEIKSSVMSASDPVELFERVAFNVFMDTPDRQMLLEASDISEKLSLLISILTREIHILSIQNEIHNKVNSAIDKGQRDYFLREELSVIKRELGEDDSPEAESEEYLKRLSELNMSEDSKARLVQEVQKLAKLPYGSQEAAVIRGYLDTVIALPWNSYTKETVDINKVRAQLDKDHYGMKRVKDRILELMAVKVLAPEVKGQIICLVGPPGVGKTSVGRSIAAALGRKYVRVSLGGVKDESDIRGHRKTYIGSMPGRIINALSQAGTKNPLILLDEIDKLSGDYRGDPASAMLEVLDSEQNKEFRDHYIELPFDLSEVMFVTTANSLDTIAPALRDRMEIIELSSYTREEKLEIAKRHLVPKQVKLSGLNGNRLRFTDAGLYELIDYYTREAGVRTLERSIASVCRKAAKEVVDGALGRISVTRELVERYLGARKFIDDLKSSVSQVGEVNGLAWTSVGGTLMPLEVLSVEGKGSIELTGSLGEVMKESAKIAVTYVRSIAAAYGIDKDFYKNRDIHIHAPEGAVPKDGPSAGVTLVTGLVSELSGIRVRADVAMTGEITLRGRVLAIGGLREKTMAAYKAGISTVIIPSANRPDLEEVDDKVRDSLEFVFADTLEDVLSCALERQTETKQPLKPRAYKLPEGKIGARLDGTKGR